MKTYYEIVEGNNYHQLSTSQKEEILNRQTQLVNQWQDETDELTKMEVFDELSDSFAGLIKNMAFKQFEKSFSIEEEDFTGIINLVLAETLMTFDRSLGKPFTPVFIMNVNNEIKMTYRQKGYDLHDTTDRLETPVAADHSVTVGDTIESSLNAVEEAETSMLTDELLTGCFGDNEKKKTVVHMTVQGYKRNEIVQAIKETDKTAESVSRYVNRTVKEFKLYYSNLIQSNLA